MNLEALLHTYFIQQQQTAFPTLFIKRIFFQVNVTDGNNGRFVYVFSVAIHAAYRHLSGRAGPSNPPHWDQTSGSFSAGPYHQSHIILIKHG